MHMKQAPSEEAIVHEGEVSTEYLNALIPVQ